MRWINIELEFPVELPVSVLVRLEPDPDPVPALELEDLEDPKMKKNCYPLRLHKKQELKIN